MNKILKLMMVMVLVTFSASASALLLDGAEVGVEDELVAWADLSNSGAGSEAEFFADYLNVSSVDIWQLDGSAGDDGNWASIDDGDEFTDLWGYYLNGETPDNLLLKTGENTGLVGVEGLFDSFIYSNNIELGYVVIDLTDFYKLQTTGSEHTVTITDIDIFRVSHVTVPHENVPEPGIMALLGVGLLGMVVARRRTKV